MYTTQQLVASNFATNRENVKGELYLNVINPFSIIVCCLCCVIAINPDLLYCIFEFLICLPSREERGLLGILAAVVIARNLLQTNRWNLYVFEFEYN